MEEARCQSHRQRALVNAPGRRNGYRGHHPSGTRPRIGVASDIRPQMLAMAEQELSRHTDRVSVRQLNAEVMTSVPSDSLDAYVISLCLKICNRTVALREALRMLKPGGRNVVLEASNIPWRVVHAAYLACMSLCVPVLVWLATGGDASAYRYLHPGVSKR
jgi:demethylmenaquinone methyltransferase / 2-methoxy-6-polyprenyl-1,4-benzoquinol methylase